MKRSTLLVGFITIASILILLACDKGSISDQESRLIEFEQFEKMGELHNVFLTNVRNNLIIDDNLSTINDRIDYINNFQIDFLSSVQLSDSVKGVIGQYFEKYKNLTDVEVTKRLALVNNDNAKEEDTVSVFTLLQVAGEKNILDTFELKVLNNMAELARMGFEGTISNYQFTSALQKMKNEWISMGYIADDNHGYVSGYAIAISIASMEWWLANPDESLLQSKGTNLLIPAWAVADAVGAIWGATSGAIGSYAINGEIKWGSVGFGALSGAVAGSTGVVGKVAKWISKVIN